MSEQTLVSMLTISADYWKARAEQLEAEVERLSHEFERGFLQGREQERALWELSAAGQAIEAEYAALDAAGRPLED